MPRTTATEPVYATDANGVRRLIAAPGDSYDPNTAIAPFGVITNPDATPVIAPLDGYDTLSEADLLDRLPGLSKDELAAVQAYERAHQARGSITTYAIASVPVAMPTPTTIPAAAAPAGYSTMSVEDLQTEADKRGLNVTGTGKDGNVLKSDLVSALEASD